MKLPVTIQEQRLWLRAIGKVLFDEQYELIDGTLNISIEPFANIGGQGVSDYEISFRAKALENIFVQAQKEYNEAVSFGLLEDEK